jgi:putative tricarboxylic transport membrane protein
MRQISTDLTAGIFLVAVAGLASFQGASLEMGTLRQIGPGMMPRGLALLLGIFGVVLIVKGYAAKPTAQTSAGGDGLSRKPSQWWKQPAVRGPVCLFAAVCLFGLSVRPLGFLVAGPLVVIVSALASAETRRGETAIFAGAMTLFCFLLFKQLLSLPIPVAPWILGY